MPEGLISIYCLAWIPPLRCLRTEKDVAALFSVRRLAGCSERRVPPGNLGINALWGAYSFT
jgi:hypothetical protein